MQIGQVVLARQQALSQTWSNAFRWLIFHSAATFRACHITVRFAAEYENWAFFPVDRNKPVILLPAPRLAFTASLALKSWKQAPSVFPETIKELLTHLDFFRRVPLGSDCLSFFDPRDRQTGDPTGMAGA